jgi:hypothetical protein
MNVIAPRRDSPNAVTALHCIAAYDRKTDALVQEFAVPAPLDTLARKIAEIDADDPDGAFSYALRDKQLAAFRFLLGLQLDTVAHEHFLEPAARQALQVSARKAAAVREIERLGLGRSPGRPWIARITERELAIPALACLDGCAGAWMGMPDLIAALTELLRPIGTDAVLLAGRSDAYFSQKVRNLVSHRRSNGSIIRLGLAEYSEQRHGLRITAAGSDLIHDLRA